MSPATGSWQRGPRCRLMTVANQQSVQTMSAGLLKTASVLSGRGQVGRRHPEVVVRTDENRRREPNSLPSHAPDLPDFRVCWLTRKRAGFSLTRDGPYPYKMERASAEVTRLLKDWSNGREQALERLVPEIHRELRKLAASYLRKERPDHTLQPTALVNEAFLKLIDQRAVQWQNVRTLRNRGAGDAADSRDHARAHAAASAATVRGRFHWMMQ